MREHLKAVGYINLIAGAFYAAVGVLVALGLMLSPWFYGAKPWSPADEAIVYVVVLLASAVFLAIGIPNLLAGLALLRQKGWVRTPAIVLAVLALPSFPIGTVAGVYAIWVLTQRETEQLLAAAA
ncbi:MAG TPA: hypothetical protein PKO09_13220 [Anaerolineae bacterium]|nr:hypothetical protein [Anaerolineae bacterium]